MAALTVNHDKRAPLTIGKHVEVPPSAERAAGAPRGDPGLLGLPSFIAGAVALGLIEVGVVSTSLVGASLPILLAATSIGLFMATIWAAAIGQSAVAGVYGIFGGFYLSYAALVLGLTHNWFGILPTQVAATQKLFLITWLVIVSMLTLATFRLPAVYTLLFTLVDGALFLALLSIIQSSTSLSKAGGYVVLAFSAIGAYLFFGAASKATGGKELPLGRPILR